MAVLAMLQDADVLPPEGTPEANRVIQVVIQFQSVFMKSGDPAVQAFLSHALAAKAGSGVDEALLPGTRRYYVLKDDDTMRVRSVLLGNVGETDCGRPEPLTDFGRYCIESFPADHYALVIWNHGAGWSGVSADENTHHTLEMGDVRGALEGMQAALKSQGKERVDVLDFDACLMATLEVAYELRNTVDFLASSQDTEPGDGMAYGEYLRWLNTYPEAPPASLAKAMVESYVKAYAPGGVQVEGDYWSGSETKTARRAGRRSSHIRR